jgi:hypothetical protein
VALEIKGLMKGWKRKVLIRRVLIEFKFIMRISGILMWRVLEETSEIAFSLNQTSSYLAKNPTAILFN